MWVVGASQRVLSTVKLSAISTCAFHTSLTSLVRRNNIPTSSNDSAINAENEDLGYDVDHANVLKVVQRFVKDPRDWPQEDQPFAMIDRNFIGKVMHQVELRPERAYANFVPLGMMFFRHFFRKVQAKTNFRVFEDSGVLNESEIRAGTNKAFELISQNAYKNTMSDLVSRGVCSAETVKRFEGASCHMSDRQRELLNLTENDIFAIAPGVLGPYQFIRPLLHNGSPHLAYGLLCCAFYKKDVLFNAVKSYPLLDEVTESDRLKMPAGYGYDAPRLIFGYITLGNESIKGTKDVDSEVKLLDFQFLVM